MNNSSCYSSVCAPPHARPSQSHLHGLDLFIVSVVSGTPGRTIIRIRANDTYVQGVEGPCCYVLSVGGIWGRRA